MPRVAKKTSAKTSAAKKVSRQNSVRAANLSKATAMAAPVEKVSARRVSLPRNFSRFAVLGLLLIVLALLLYRNKGMFVAAMVNNQPIMRLSLDKQLESQYGDATLDEMVGEMLIRQAAAKNKITVTPAEIETKIASIEKTLNGQISLQDALAQQGETVADFRHRVELQLMLEKLTAGKVQVSDQEISDYIDKNRASMTATDEAGLREEAKTDLTNQKQNTILQQYFSSLKSQAKILKFF
ncbi:SurA N-terminal domain-containing protein [Patescibacteria group bacterium]|nr:SurA N-terminal domain-containing protein [Patescibacteria group bacterium]